MAKAAYYTVRESFITVFDGEEVEYHEGEVVDADDPAIKRAPSHFEPLVLRPNRRSTDVEQATAAPGEQRETTGHALTTADIRPRKRG